MSFTHVVVALPISLTRNHNSMLNHEEKTLLSSRRRTEDKSATKAFTAIKCSEECAFTSIWALRVQRPNNTDDLNKDGGTTKR